MKLPSAIEKRIVELLVDGGMDKDSNVIMNHMNLSNAPPDLYLTESALLRAKHEAKDIDAEYYCYMCGTHHDTAEDFINCMHQHIIGFYAAIPPSMTDEHMEKVLSNTPKHMRDNLKTVLKNNQEKKEDE